jgi:hypothetical protein
MKTEILKEVMGKNKNPHLHWRLKKVKLTIDWKKWLQMT